MVTKIAPQQLCNAAVDQFKWTEVNSRTLGRIRSLSSIIHYTRTTLKIMDGNCWKSGIPRMNWAWWYSEQCSPPIRLLSLTKTTFAADMLLVRVKQNRSSDALCCFEIKRMIRYFSLQRFCCTRTRKGKLAVHWTTQAGKKWKIPGLSQKTVEDLRKAQSHWDYLRNCFKDHWTLLAICTLWWSFRTFMQISCYRGLRLISGSFRNTITLVPRGYQSASFQHCFVIFFPLPNSITQLFLQALVEPHRDRACDFLALR